MGMGAWSRWVCFTVYIAFLITMPLALLWEWQGLVMGLVLSLSFLFYLGYRGAERISERLQVKRLSMAQAPHLFASVNEYCRRLEMPAPQLGVIETPALNVAVYGFDVKRSYLVITRGALETLKRDELSALLGRQLSYLWHGDVFGDTWLCQFLAVLDKAISPRSHVTHHSHGRRTYTFKVFIRQLLLYPLTLFPAFLLRGSSSQDSVELDLKTVRMTKKPHALVEGLRILEAFQERIPFHSPLSSRHLFLLPPPTLDPLGRVFLASEGLTERIQALGKLTQTVTLS